LIRTSEKIAGFVLSFIMFILLFGAYGSIAIPNTKRRQKVLKTL